MMGGEIGVESEVGKGSTFTFTIQVKRGENKPQVLSDSGINMNNIRILAVDDDNDILIFFTRIMQEFGIYCDTAAGAEEALNLINEKGAYNIYFIDWKMPGIDGIELTRKLKEKAAVPGKAVVIMISATEWSVIEEEAKKAGVDKFISKPLFPSSIADVINECVGHRQKDRASNLKGIGIKIKRGQILLAEDVEINREIAKVLLEPYVLNVDEAENGVEAVNKFSQNPDLYDVILMDVQMPVMDGYEATRRIRAMDFPKAKDIPIIALTANVFKEDIEKCFSAGMNDHLGKPIDQDDLLSMLDQYLPKPRRNSAAGS
jgi:CheY-like chemotaxis protein